MHDPPVLPSARSTTGPTAHRRRGHPRRHGSRRPGVPLGRLGRDGDAAQPDRLGRDVEHQLVRWRRAPERDQRRHRRSLQLGRRAGLGHVLAGQHGLGPELQPDRDGLGWLHHRLRPRLQRRSLDQRDHVHERGHRHWHLLTGDRHLRHPDRAVHSTSPSTHRAAAAAATPSPSPAPAARPAPSARPRACRSAPATRPPARRSPTAPPASRPGCRSTPRPG
jgi:hypothetical protein